MSAIETIDRSPATLGLAVPDDLSVVGFDNVPESALSEPPLTTVDQSIQRMGFEAVRLLLDLIEDPAREPEQVVLPDAARRARLVSSARGAGVTTSEVARRRLPRPGAAAEERVDDLLGRMTLRGEARAARQPLGLPARRRRRPDAGERRSAAPRASAR